MPHEEIDWSNEFAPFKRPLPAFEFASLAFAALEKLHTRESELRRNANLKRLMEEILPIAVFAKSLEGPERHLTVTYVGDTKKFDGEMLITGALVKSGFLKPKYYLEVTSAVAPYEYLQREAMARYGSVFGGPNIRATGSTGHRNRQIINKPTVSDIGSAVEDSKDWVHKAISKKSGLDYPRPCILLVRVEPESNLALSEWESLVMSVRDISAASGFSDVYLVHTSTGAAHQVSSKSPSFRF